MEIKITVPAKYIAVLMLFSAKNDERKYFNGINFEIGGAEVRMVATDGHRLGCFRIKSEQEGITEPRTNLIVPIELFERIALEGGDVIVTFGKERAGASQPVTVSQGDLLRLAGETIYAKYPDWRKAIPKKVSGEAAQLNPAYIHDLVMAWGVLHGSAPHRALIGHNGEKPALVDLYDENFIGVVAALTETKTLKAPPSWAHKPVPTVEAKAPAAEAIDDLL